MDIIFGLLLLASFFALFLGLIRPSIINRFSKQDWGRKKIFTYFGLASTIFFILTGITVPPTQNTTSLEAVGQQTQESTVDTNVSPEEINLETPLLASPSPSPTPSQRPTPTIRPSTTNDTDYYTNSLGNKVQSPTYSETAPDGATAKCRDGTYSFSQSRRGTCSHHGGVAQWL